MLNTTSVAGIIAGRDPFEYSSSSPYTLFFFQAIVIIVFAELLYVPLRRLKQPKVIAEVIGGILLGPSAIGKIPGFTKTVFPDASIPGLTLMANVGVCLLLFIVGCEVDLHFIKKHMRVALSVGIFNMAVPFGLGCLISIGLWKDYRETVEPHIKFTTFLVFVAVAMCITAFPVLARILTQLKLVKDRVGVIVLAAGVTNDLLGWVLLALCVTLANSSKPETTGYIVLVALGWMLFVIFPVRWTLRWFLFNVVKDIDNHSGPSQLSTLVILCTALLSAFFTDIIGVHAIFGAFVVGTIVPRENDYVARLAARIEDLVYVMLIPLYFALAGLNVNLGLLSQGRDWGYIIGIISLAMVGKIGGGFIAAKFNGLYSRESVAVGVLMSCKGIVEIVVLKTGLSASIITPKLYSMFIVMALATTVFTTPLTLLVYPESYRQNVQKWLKNREFAERISIQDSDKGDKGSVREVGGSLEVSQVPDVTLQTFDEFSIPKIIFSITNTESVSNAMVFIERVCQVSNGGRGTSVHALYIKQLTERISDLILASNYTATANEVGKHKLNATLSILKIFCGFKNVDFSSEIRFVSSDEHSVFAGLSGEDFDVSALLLHFVHQKKFLDLLVDSDGLIDSLRALKSGTGSHIGVFVNNNQEDNNQDAGDEDATDDSSLFSTQTILNPESFQLTTITLVLNFSGAPRLSVTDLVALKLLLRLAASERIELASIMVNAANCPTEEIDALKWVTKGLTEVNLLLCTETGEFEAFIDSNSPSFSGISNLVLVSSNEAHDEMKFVEESIRRNSKLLVLYQ
ncbi:unnamed protein product [Kuraishia capsulata CBS 1993]|uniref:Cation/H+ exchanger transmembrane domain-containing protein n=1 Tax=Kuraishia capsulata CBS 1993 TaxID=1382522 RepID=W6MSX4_9ASCO|nr:uncharacterized protein KUCA_T00004309001 [Kuraishia capsulata CBS 1993]CDK28327.1 unnamed protein product [Kuraishia capsulata CBS 1993]